MKHISVGLFVVFCCLAVALVDADCGGGCGNPDPPIVPGGCDNTCGNCECARGYTHGHNGRPTCSDSTEVNKLWRNNFDPIFYWKCEGGKAVKVQCPGEQGFCQNLQKCVGWGTWQWTPPCDPPTKAPNTDDTPVVPCN